MAVRISGINSGLDTDSIVQELVSAYSKKTEKYQKEQTKLGWKQDIWKDLNKKVNAFYKKVGNLKYSSGYNTKKVTSSDTTKATVTASSGAVNGTQKLHVLSTAQSGYMTSAQVKSKLTGATAKSDTTLSTLGFTDSSSIRLQAMDKDGNKIDKQINLNWNSKVSDVVKQLQDAGVNASYDEKNGRFYISSAKTGKEGDFTLSDDGSEASKRLLRMLGLDTSEKLMGGTLTRADNQGVTAATTLSELGMTDDDFLDFGIEIVDRDGNRTNKTISLSKDTTVSDVAAVLRGAAGVDAYYDDAEKRFIVRSDGGGSITINSQTNADGKDSQKLLNALGLGTGMTYGQDATKLAGVDATIVLNGVEYTSSSNNFSINGLNIAVSGVTDNISKTNGKFDLNQLDESKAVSLNVSTDVQGLYDKIKDFMTEYNNLINEITKLYNAGNAKGYEPLTDDEKNEMSDREIEQWETKIKDSLLRRDDNLSTVMRSMTAVMSKNYTVNGKTYALSSFGIKTLGIMNAAENEQNAFHIDGDADDENTSGNKDRLMEVLTSDPDTVVDFMKQLTTDLYNTLDEQMKSSTLRSKFSIYNDKEMDKQYKNYEKTIKEWEKKVQEKEDYYYKKFAAMETALGNLNSQQSSLAGLFGSN